MASPAYENSAPLLSRGGSTAPSPAELPEKAKEERSEPACSASQSSLAACKCCLAVDVRFELCCGWPACIGRGQLCASKPLTPMQSTAPPVKASVSMHHQCEAASFWWVCAAPLSGLWVCASGRQLQPGSGSVAPRSRPPQPQNLCSVHVPCLSAPAFEPGARGPPVGRVDAAAGAASVFCGPLPRPAMRACQSGSRQPR